MIHVIPAPTNQPSPTEGIDPFQDLATGTSTPSTAAAAHARTARPAIIGMSRREKTTPATTAPARHGSAREDSAMALGVIRARAIVGPNVTRVPSIVKPTNPSV